MRNLLIAASLLTLGACSSSPTEPRPSGLLRDGSCIIVQGSGTFTCASARQAPASPASAASDCIIVQGSGTLVCDPKASARVSVQNADARIIVQGSGT